MQVSARQWVRGRIPHLKVPRAELPPASPASFPEVARRHEGTSFETPVRSPAGWCAPQPERNRFGATRAHREPLGVQLSLRVLHAEEAISPPPETRHLPLSIPRDDGRAQKD